MTKPTLTAEHFRADGAIRKPVAAWLHSLGWKYCPCCEDVKRLRYFREDPSKPRGLNGYCRKCRPAKDHQFYMNTPRAREYRAGIPSQ